MQDKNPHIKTRYTVYRYHSIENSWQYPKMLLQYTKIQYIAEPIIIYYTIMNFIDMATSIIRPLFVWLH